MHRLLFVLLLTTGCAGGDPGGTAAQPTPGGADTGLPPGVEAPLYSGTFDKPTWAGLDGLDLPPGPNGAGYTLAETPGGTLWADLTQRDAVTAAAACASLVGACLSPDTRNVHGCLIHAGTCQTETPWTEEPCCPAACVPAYTGRRAAGQDEVDALMGAIFDDDGCIPGLDAPTGGDR